MTKPVKIILIVVAVLAACVLVCLPILFALAIPAMQHVIKQANQTSAMASLRILNQMEVEYNVTYPDHGFACSLATLGGAQSGPPTADAAQLISADLASGKKVGYTFAISGCTKKTVGKQEQVTGYHITATPDRAGHTGDRTYCTDETAQIWFDPKGAGNCTELLQ